MELVDLKSEAGEGLYSGSAPTPAWNPYPYGLRLVLNEEILAKLGYKDLPPAGTECRIEAVGVVVRSASEDPDADGDVDCLCVEIQLKELGLEEEGELSEEDDDEDGGEHEGRAERMYGKGKQPA